MIFKVNVASRCAGVATPEGFSKKTIVHYYWVNLFLVLDKKRHLWCFRKLPMMRKLVITIDGPSGAGKSTVSQLLAERLGYTYVDTGALYRVVALKVKQNHCDPADEKKLSVPLSKMIDGYYRLRGYNKQGVPTRGRLKKLGIKKDVA